MADKSSKEYISRSWQMLTHDKGWYKPFLVMPLAQLVPIAGPLGVWGYRYEWARLSAWGIETYPKQGKVKVGACIRSGWRVFVAELGYLVALMLITLAIGGRDAGTLADLLWGYVATLAVTIAAVAALRATIYQKASAGYQLDRIWDMLKRDFASLALMAFAQFLWTLLTEGFVALFAILFALPSAVQLLSLLSYSATGAQAAYLISAFMAQYAPWLVLVCYVASVLWCTFTTIIVNALGLWMAQFDVPAWKSSKDPLPADAPEASASESAQDADAPSAAAGHAEESAPAAPAEDRDRTEEESNEVPKPAQGLPAIGESSAPEDEPATLILPKDPSDGSGPAEG